MIRNSNKLIADTSRDEDQLPRKIQNLNHVNVYTGEQTQTSFSF